MSTVTRPRGPLPARVYWVRRMLVLATVLALVFAVGRMVGGSAEEPAKANPASASPTVQDTPQPDPQVSGPVGVTEKPTTRKTTKKPAALAQPDGACEADDITVTPTITRAAAGKTVRIGLELTGIKPACTFAISKSSFAVRIVQGAKRIWTSQQCPSAIPRQTVVVRSAAPTAIQVTWSGRRSDPDCKRSTPWALPGPYRVAAAVIGSEPGEKKFTLTSPPRPVVVQTVTAKPEKKKSGQ